MQACGFTLDFAVYYVKITTKDFCLTCNAKGDIIIEDKCIYYNNICSFLRKIVVFAYEKLMLSEVYWTFKKCKQGIHERRYATGVLQNMAKEG